MCVDFQAILVDKIALEKENEHICEKERNTSRSWDFSPHSRLMKWGCWMPPRPRMLLVLLVASAAARPLPVTLPDFAEYCVSSRWGFSCFADGAAASGRAATRLVGPAKLLVVGSVLGTVGAAIVADVCDLPRAVRRGELVQATLPGAVQPPRQRGEAARGKAGRAAAARGRGARSDGDPETIWVEAIASRSDFL